MEQLKNELKDQKVLIIDDDIYINNMLKITFEQDGAIVYTAANGREGLQTFFVERPDLVILDIMMPGIDGWEVCRHIRLVSDTPIIMLTTLRKDDDVIQGLEYGADDFVNKPCSGKVLLARARATLRRTKAIMKITQELTDYKDNYLSVDIESQRVMVAGEPIKLTATEFRMLTYLLENAGRVLTYNQILDSVWGWEYRDSIDYVHVYASHLRRKLEENPRSPKYLLTVHGVGYRFATKN